MDLHIIQMFQTHIVFFCNIKSIPCEMRIVGGMRISSSDPAAGQDRILCINLYRDLSARLDLFLGVDLLLIDDLGTELVTRYTQAEVYDLVNHRLNTGKPTIINTNLGLQEIERTYSSRVHSRLAGMYAVVQFKGRDIRLQKKQEGYR